jgi:hypothetical protein
MATTVARAWRAQASNAVAARAVTDPRDQRYRFARCKAPCVTRAERSGSGGAVAGERQGFAREGRSAPSKKLGELDPFTGGAVFEFNPPEQWRSPATAGRSPPVRIQFDHQPAITGHRRALATSSNSIRSPTGDHRPPPGARHQFEFNSITNRRSPATTGRSPVTGQSSTRASADTALTSPTILSGPYPQRPPLGDGRTVSTVRP